MYTIANRDGRTWRGWSGTRGSGGDNNRSAT